MTKITANKIKTITETFERESWICPECGYYNLLADEDEFNEIIIGEVYICEDCNEEFEILEDNADIE